MTGTLPLYILLFAMLVAWLRIELKHSATSRGMASIVLGSLILSFGISNTDHVITLFRWLAIALGLAMALYGTAKLTAHFVKSDSAS